MPSLTTVHPADVIHHINEIFDFVKHMKSLIRRKKRPEIIEVAEEVLIGVDGQNVFSVNRKLLADVAPTVADFERLLTQLNPDRFQKLTLKTPQGLELDIDYQHELHQTATQQKKLLSDVRRLSSEVSRGVLPADRETQSLSERVKLSGLIRAFDLDKNIGRFRTQGNWNIPSGTYPFIYTGSEPAVRLSELLGNVCVSIEATAERQSPRKWRLIAFSIKPEAALDANT